MFITKRGWMGGRFRLLAYPVRVFIGHPTVHPPPQIGHPPWTVLLSTGSVLNSWYTTFYLQNILDFVAKS